MKQPTNPHRPDVKPGKGFRILADGEAIQQGDEIQIMLQRRPLRLGWVDVEDSRVNLSGGFPIGRKATCDWSAVRTKRPLP